MSAIQNRYDFVYLFDVTNGNPNGDPDAGNMPRLDPETSQGLVSDVCLKRKIRNYTAITRDDKQGYELYVAERAILNQQHRRGREAVGLPDKKKEDLKKLPKDKAKARELTLWMCRNFFDIRTFGAVMTTEVNCGQVRGPVQFGFARSVSPILPLEMSITRMAVTTEKSSEEQSENRTMGRKHIVPYGLYRTHGYISASLADDTGMGTGFSEDDLELLWEALENLFEHDRSAARGEMVSRGLKIFRHQSPLGNAKAHELFERVSVNRVFSGDVYNLDDPRVHNLPPARAFSDYRISVDWADPPQGVELIERI